MKMKTLFVSLLISLCFTEAAVAANQPCSGKKGGIARCAGDKFVCKDGSISASKKTCTTSWESVDKGKSAATPPANARKNPAAGK